MRKKALFSILIIILLPLLILGGNGFTAKFQTATFQKGIPLSGTSFGFKTGAFTPYAGLNIARIALDYESKSTDWNRNYDNNDLHKTYSSTNSIEGQAILFLPHIGLKMDIKSIDNCKAYLLSEVSHAFSSIDGKTKYKDIEYNSDGSIGYIEEDEHKLSDDDKDIINDALDFWSIKLGFGAEYYLTKHVSIGGEFGFRMFMADLENNDSDKSEYHGVTEYKYEWKDEINANLGLTYTAFHLNFIF